jgi:flavin reductase (DIM6/NTAB) family NADH-FMN oxidoreductase RutF
MHNLIQQDVFIDISEGKYKRGVLNAIVAPRPIGWISSIGASGRVNLAPFSYFNIMANDPPIVVFSANAPEDRTVKDTVRNVRETGEFVVNMVSHDLVRQMNMTSTPVPYDVDEFEFAGLRKAESRFVRPPRVCGTPAALECKSIREVVLEQAGGQRFVVMSIGQVVGMHIGAGFLDDNGHFHTDLANPVTRLGGAEYAVAAPSFILERQFTRAGEKSY